MLSTETMKGTAAPELAGRVYREMFINSRDLEIPRNKYQRRFRSELAEKIAKDFAEWFGSAETQAAWSEEFDSYPCNVDAAAAEFDETPAIYTIVHIPSPRNF